MLERCAAVGPRRVRVACVTPGRSCPPAQGSSHANHPGGPSSGARLTPAPTTSRPPTSIAPFVGRLEPGDQPVPLRSWAVFLLALVACIPLASFYRFSNLFSKFAHFLLVMVSLLENTTPHRIRHGLWHRWRFRRMQHNKPWIQPQPDKPQAHIDGHLPGAGVGGEALQPANESGKEKPWLSASFFLF